MLRMGWSTPFDTRHSLDARARSYLHANCAMCHHPGGNAIVSFYLNRDLPFEQLKTNKGTGIGTFGMRDAKIIAKGDPYRSVLMYRMSKLGYGRMPYIGSGLVDSRGIALIEDWIRSLSDKPTPASEPLADDSKAAQALGLISQAGNDRTKRDDALQTLIESTPGTLALIGRMHRGELNKADFQQALAIGGKSKRSDIRGLLETFIPRVATPDSIGLADRPADDSKTSAATGLAAS